MRKLNRQDIAWAISRETRINYRIVDRIVGNMIEHISRAVAQGDKVSLSGFGVFEPKRRAARVGRNMCTNEQVHIPSRTVPVFSPSKEFKDIVSINDVREDVGFSKTK